MDSNSILGDDIKKNTDELVTADAFEKIVIITERDERETSDICTALLEDMSGFFTDIQDRKWCENLYKNAFGMEKCVNLLLVIIPKEHTGALEKCFGILNSL